MNCVSVRAIIEYEGKFLLVRNRSFAPHDFWCLPGGRIESGENMLAALERELIEETGIRPEIGNLVYVHQIKEQNSSFCAPELFFHIKNSKDYLNCDLSGGVCGKGELDEIGWVDIAKINVLPKFLAKELPDIVKDNFDIKTQLRFE